MDIVNVGRLDPFFVNQRFDQVVSHTSIAFRWRIQRRHLTGRDERVFARCGVPNRYVELQIQETRDQRA